MKTPDMTFRSQRLGRILTQAEGLGVKIPTAILEKVERGEALSDLIRPITDAEIATATTETIGGLVERARENATYQTPAANAEFDRLRNALELDLYNTVRNHAFEIYNDIVAKLEKPFAAMNKVASKVPYAFAAHPETWEHYDNDTRNALTSLREQAAKVTGLASLLDLISAEFWPFDKNAPREVAAIGPLQMFYDFSGFDSPTLALFKLPEWSPSLSVEMITYLAERGVKLRAQKIGERRATEKALIEQARGYAQLDDGRLVPAEEAPQKHIQLAQVPSNARNDIGEATVSTLTPYM